MISAVKAASSSGSLASCAASIGVVSRRCQARLLHDRRTHGVGRGLKIPFAASARGSACPASDTTPLAGAKYSRSPTPSAALPVRPSGRHTHSPSIVRYFLHAYRSDRVCYCRPVHQHINLPQLRNDLFSRMPLPCQRSYLPFETHTSGRTTSEG